MASRIDGTLKAEYTCAIDNVFEVDTGNIGRVHMRKNGAPSELTPVPL